MASARGHAEVMSVLIEAGADINSRRLDGATPLFRAAEARRVEAVKLLLRVKADALLGAKDQAGQFGPPLVVAAQRGYSEVVWELIQQVGIEGCGDTESCAEALEIAANLEITRMLTGAGMVDTGAALINAARRGRVATTKFLLQQPKGSAKRRRAYVNARSKNGSNTTALMASIAGGASLRIARLLVDAGADTTSPVNAELDDGGLAFGVKPLDCTNSLLREKEGEKRYGRGDAKASTEKQLNSLKAIRRLLLQVAAVHAASWLWPSNASSTAPATTAVGDLNTSTLASTALTAVLPILRRRTRRPTVLLTAVFRHSAKP